MAVSRHLEHVTELFDVAALVSRLGVFPEALSNDSRRIDKNCAFLAYPGKTSDGRDYIHKALSAGSVGVFWDSENFVWNEQWAVPNVAVPHLRSHAGQIADFIYKSPSEKLNIAAVTGTSGKTTITHFAAQLCGVSQSAIIGTLGAGFIGNLQKTDNTTPDATLIHSMLADFADAGAQAAFIEASSHGIVQNRLAGVHLNCAVFNNARRDHTDYHGNLSAYWQAKTSLMKTPGLKTAILNADDDYCSSLADSLSAEQVLDYGVGGKDLHFLAGSSGTNGWILQADGICGRREFKLPFVGWYNMENFAAAALIVNSFGVEWDDIQAAASHLTLPPGRLQRINPQELPAVYVDYAHKPDALSAVLDALVGKRLILVLGCGGERDNEKRAEMGQLAAEKADIVYITDDNPRSEDPAAIRTTIIGNNKKRLNEIAGRGEAIAAAIAEADDDDVVLIAGKGHEGYQEINGRQIPFSDKDEALSYLARREKARL